MCPRESFKHVMDQQPLKGEKELGTGPGSYSYNYYGATYSAIGNAAQSESAVQRGFQDYALVIRERIWYIVVVFLLVFSAVTVYTFTAQKTYQSTASVQIYRRDPMVMKVQNVMDNEIRGAEDLNTQVKILESAGIVQRVADRLTGDDLRQFLAPYTREEGEEPISAAEIIAKNRKIVPVRLSLIIQVQYTHPDKFIAAKVSNLFIDEYIFSNSRLRIEESMKAVDDLKVRAEQQKKRVEEIANSLQAYREKNNLISLDQRKDIVTEKLRALSLFVTQSNNRKNEAEVRWKQVQERKDDVMKLKELPFIATTQVISQLMQQYSNANVAVRQLEERYRPKHPKMIEAVNVSSQVRTELEHALLTAASNTEAEYQTAVRSYNEALSDLKKQEAESLDVDRYAVEYSNMERDLRITEQLLDATLSRMKETSMSATIETQNARVVDKAAPALKPSFPNIPLNLALGVVGGLFLGTAFAFFVAYIDDCVKSSFDIESVIGLPLIGIIPEVKRMDQPEKAQVVASNSDKQVAEAFLALHSSLRLKDESKRAKTIMTTSTIPGEGKSFVTSNLALTFAAHGEKVVIIDCDLRKPNVHRSFRLENLKGVIDICGGNASIDDVVVKGVHPNLDIITSGGRAKNPTQILNSRGFEIMLSDLRKRYDRVFIDTPPLAAVSDAMIVLPLIDGSIFSIYFNKVRRKAAQFAARKLLEVNVPCFGAVLNGLNLAISGYYYAQYYDKSYKDYYITVEKELAKEAPAR